MSSVCFSPDGERVASALGQDHQDMENAHREELATLKGHGHGVECVGFSPDGKRLARASSDKTIKGVELPRRARSNSSWWVTLRKW